MPELGAILYVAYYATRARRRRRRSLSRSFTPPLYAGRRHLYYAFVTPLTGQMV